MCLLRVLEYVAPKREISCQPAFQQNFVFRLGRDKCHGPDCFHLSFEDGCEEEHCEKKSLQPCQTCARMAESVSVLHAHGGNRISSVDQMAVGPCGSGHE